jgi:hypothetical protein
LYNKFLYIPPFLLPLPPSPLLLFSPSLPPPPPPPPLSFPTHDGPRTTLIHSLENRKRTATIMTITIVRTHNVGDCTIVV